MKSNEFQRKLQELIKRGLACLDEGPACEFVIPPYITFIELNQDGYANTCIEIVTPKIIENILNEFGWENVDNDKDWDDTYMTYVKDNKEFIFFYNGYTYEKLFYNMHERGDES